MTSVETGASRRRLLAVELQLLNEAGSSRRSTSENVWLNQQSFTASALQIKQTTIKRSRKERTSQ